MGRWPTMRRFRRPFETASDFDERSPDLLEMEGWSGGHLAAPPPTCSCGRRDELEAGGPCGGARSRFLRRPELRNRSITRRFGRHRGASRHCLLTLSRISAGGTSSTGSRTSKRAHRKCAVIFEHVFIKTKCPGHFFSTFTPSMPLMPGRPMSKAPRPQWPQSPEARPMVRSCRPNEASVLFRRNSRHCGT
jgi:hypothetical protein